MSSTITNTIVGILGIGIPVMAFLIEHGAAKNTFLIACAALIVALASVNNGSRLDK